MSAANLFRTFVSRIVPIFLLSTAFAATVPSAFAATEIVAPIQTTRLKQAEANSSPMTESLSSPAATGPLRILLVDDDWSDNNYTPGDSRLSASDRIFQQLASDAVGGDAAAWEIETVNTYANGPGIDRLRKFSLILWYTGSSYGGNPDNSGVLSIEDEKTVRRYLEEIGGSVILFSPGYASNAFGAGSTWEQTSWPFMNEVLGIRGGKGLAQRFEPGTVTTTQGTQFHVDKGGVVESQFSAVNPGGASVVFTAELDAMKSTSNPIPVATSYSYGKGRIIYVGFSFENLAAKELSPAFQQLLLAGGQNTPTRLTRGIGKTVSTLPETPPPPPPPPAPAPAPAHVYYANCDAVRAAGAAPIYRGDPGYSSKLDREGDGIGCEN